MVVLGDVGRNFAAGMTGGVAFVLDEAERLPVRCNLEHVTIERLADPEDEAHLLRLIAEHRTRTGSPRAAEVLARWDSFGPRFWKVAPKPSPPAVRPQVSEMAQAEVRLHSDRA